MEHAMDPLMFVCVVAVICTVWLAVVYINAYRKYQAALEQAVTEEILKRLVTTKLEVHQGCFYLFREDNDSFVAQGHDAKELLEHINLRFRHMKFFITQGDRQVIDSLQQQLDSLGDQAPIQDQ
jgi:hypothetical protein